jgi:mannose-1-phosphate guanylyltransferase
MNAILLAAGLGTRLRPLTDSTPKCLVTIGGVALMDIWLSGLSKAGFNRFLINTHHLSGLVQAHLDVHPLHAVIETVFEDKLLGTGGTLRANKDFCMRGTTLIAHADNLCLCDWNAFLQAHAARPDGTIMTMMTFRTPTPQSCGIVQLDSRGVVQQFFEKHPSPPDDLANAAIYLIEPAVIKQLLTSSSQITDISTELLPKLLGKINTWHNANTVIDIGTPESLESAQNKYSADVHEILESQS